MKTVTLEVEDYLYEYYQKIGKSAGGLSAEKVMADALFRLAGGLSLRAMQETARERLLRSLTDGL